MGPQGDAPGPTEPIRVQLEGCTYQLNVWKEDDGRRWLFRLLKMVAEGGSMGAGADMLARLGAIVGVIDEKTFESLWQVCQSYTVLVTQDEKGEGGVALATVAAAHLRGRYLTMVGLIGAHLKRQFAGFFTGLPAMLAGLGVAAPEKTK